MEIRNVAELASLARQVKEYITEINNYSAALGSAIQTCDLNNLDLDHILEMQPLSAPEIIKLAQTKKAVLLERRKYKDELALIRRVNPASWDKLYAISQEILSCYPEKPWGDRKYSLRGNLRQCSHIRKSDHLQRILEAGVIS